VQCVICVEVSFPSAKEAALIKVSFMAYNLGYLTMDQNDQVHYSVRDVAFLVIEQP
jgi:hypothetical protein